MRSLLEIRLVERRAASSPNPCRAAEAALPVAVQGTVPCGRHHLTFIESLAVALGAQSSCLKQHDLEATTSQL
jgi:hypothetical protein